MKKQVSQIPTASQTGEAGKTRGGAPEPQLLVCFLLSSWGKGARAELIWLGQGWRWLGQRDIGVADHGHLSLCCVRAKPFLGEKWPTCFRGGFGGGNSLPVLRVPLWLLPDMPPWPSPHPWGSSRGLRATRLRWTWVPPGLLHSAQLWLLLLEERKGWRIGKGKGGLWTAMSSSHPVMSLHSKFTRRIVCVLAGTNSFQNSSVTAAPLDPLPSVVAKANFCSVQWEVKCPEGPTEITWVYHFCEPLLVWKKSKLQ